VNRYVIIGTPDEIAKINDPAVAMLVYDLQKEEARTSQSFQMVITSIGLALFYIALRMPTHSIVTVILAQQLVETAMRQLASRARKRTLETLLGKAKSQ
jgi:hypothetical protein